MPPSDCPLGALLPWLAGELHIAYSGVFHVPVGAMGGLAAAVVVHMFAEFRVLVQIWTTLSVSGLNFKSRTVAIFISYNS
jgi:hypothetical protein